MNWIFAHLIGDYLLQNDWMAQNKKRSNLACLCHIVFYLLPFIFCNFQVWQIVLIGIQHYFQDRTNFIPWLMKFKGSKAFASPPFAPWSIILTDNIVHILFITLISYIGNFV